MPQQRRILVTSALPYANGPLHLGHLLEHIQTDIWVRFHRMQDRECIAICGSDAHGTPIMIKAEQLGISPEVLVKNIQAEHEQHFKDFLIQYDYYHTTHSEENKTLSSLIYERLKERGDIISKTVQQAFDPVKNMFLPDRYVKGTCPRCNAEDQYGDNCEKCGATYDPTELKNPYSVLSGSTPVQKTSEHFFFNLPRYTDFLTEWTQQHLQGEVANKLKEWFKEGLKPWDISRDAPYFGFEIPGEPGKYFYVWLDAPIGYMASFKKYCETRPKISFDDFWLDELQRSSKDTHPMPELFHFVGKDIVYFHALFWPALLHGSGFRTPTSIFTHGFVTVQGEKMSKSRGTFITAERYLQHLNPEYLRYYFAAKLGSRLEDIDLSFEDFRQRINADLVGKVVNIASRSARFIQQYFNNQLSAALVDPDLYQRFLDAQSVIAEDYESREYAKAVRTIMSLADTANQYIDTQKPWTVVKESGPIESVHQVCTLSLNLFRLLIVYLKPVLPGLAAQVENFLNLPPQNWKAIQTPLLNHTINPFQPLMTRIEKEMIEAILKTDE